MFLRRAYIFGQGYPGIIVQKEIAADTKKLMHHPEISLKI